ncbi:MAG: EAL domain-containing protein [Anaerovoracaceae bacterium]
MNKGKTTSSKDKRIYIVTIACFLFICIIMSILCFQYYSSLKDTVKGESDGYMGEISKQMSTNVSKTINDNYSVLETISEVLEKANISSYKKLNNLVSDLQDLWGYEKILLIDTKGIAHGVDGESINLTNDEYLQNTIVDREQAMSATQIIDGKECIVFSVPLDKINFNGREMGAIAGVYNLDTFDQIISMTAFDGKSYAHIIRKDGTIVVRSSSPKSLDMGYNILNSLSRQTIKDDKNIENVKDDIAAGKSGQIEFEMGKHNEYMTYTPLEGLDWSLLTFVPVSVVNEKSVVILKLTMVLCSVVTIAFALLVGIMLIVFYRNKRRLENIAYVDSLTLGNTIERFYDLSAGLISDMSNKQQGADVPKEQYAMIYTNIEKFKVLNDQFGREACDEVLRSIQNGVGDDLSDTECIGRLLADNFCVLIKYKDEKDLIGRFDKWYKGCEDYMKRANTPWLPLTLILGVYIITDDKTPVISMVDRAKLALTGNLDEIHSKLKYSIYDEEIRKVLFREKKLEDRMEAALDTGEFKVFLQPKVDTQSELIIGAEALVRWIDIEGTMAYPDEFIPLFEKNAFIVKLDFEVFRQVCETINKWIIQGIEPIKISVNCSRIHLRDKNFLDTYAKIADEYKVPHKLLEIELTENVVFEDVEYLSEIIRKIHDMGFGCSMDDFGSGYSSLNLIKDIPVDTLKLDKIFFRNTGEILRTESVVGGIITIAKALSMKTVAEGVEEKIHVDMLKKLNCDYIQGYYFAKPMPIDEFEKRTFKQK